MSDIEEYEYLMKCLGKGVADTDQQQDAAERIQKLEGKLEKVTDVALRLYYGTGVVTADMHATLAELTGGNDE